RPVREQVECDGAGRDEEDPDPDGPVRQPVGDLVERAELPIGRKLDALRMAVLQLVGRGKERSHAVTLYSRSRSRAPSPYLGTASTPSLLPGPRPSFMVQHRGLPLRASACRRLPGPEKAATFQQARPCCPGP